MYPWKRAARKHQRDSGEFLVDKKGTDFNNASRPVKDGENKKRKKMGLKFWY